MTEGFLLADPPVASLDDSLARGGCVGLTRAGELDPDQIVQEVNLAGLRGRGGAGFRCGVKWTSVQRGGGRVHYVVCNAAEGEPATFEDRALLRANPYQVAEGLVDRRARPNGAEWFGSMGTAESSGTVICTVVGDVERPGVVEVEMGIPLRDVLERCGAPRPGREVRGVFAGISNPVLTAEQIDVLVGGSP